MFLITFASFTRSEMFVVVNVIIGFSNESECIWLWILFYRIGHMTLSLHRTSISVWVVEWLPLPLPFPLTRARLREGERRRHADEQWSSSVENQSNFSYLSFFFIITNFLDLCPRTCLLQIDCTIYQVAGFVFIFGYVVVFLCARRFSPPSRNSFCYSYKEMVTNFFFTATNGKNTDLFSFTPIHPSTISWLIELSLLCVWKAK